MSTSFATASRRQVRRLALALSLAATVAALSGCYVVPMQPTAGAPVQSPSMAAAGVAAPAPVAPAVQTPLSFSARMYPANELAAKYGVVQGMVTNDLHGRGVFTATVAGESFSGEATRNANSSREGMANGAGSRGGWMKCNYRMNNSSMGTGQCELNNGALFNMHLGG